MTKIGFMTMASSEDKLARPSTAGCMHMGYTGLNLDADGNTLPVGEVCEVYARIILTTQSGGKAWPCFDW